MRCSHPLTATPSPHLRPPPAPFSNSFRLLSHCGLLSPFIKTLLFHSRTQIWPSFSTIPNHVLFFQTVNLTRHIILPSTTSHALSPPNSFQSQHGSQSISFILLPTSHPAPQAHLPIFFLHPVVLGAPSSRSVSSSLFVKVFQRSWASAPRTRSSLPSWEPPPRFLFIPQPVWWAFLCAEFHAFLSASPLASNPWSFIQVFMQFSSAPSPQA